MSKTKSFLFISITCALLVGLIYQSSINAKSLFVELERELKACDVEEFREGGNLRGVQYSGECSLPALTDSLHFFHRSCLGIALGGPQPTYVFLRRLFNHSPPYPRA
jgi:hypothetical protein